MLVFFNLGPKLTYYGKQLHNGSNRWKINKMRPGSFSIRHGKEVKSLNCIDTLVFSKKLIASITPNKLPKPKFDIKSFEK